MSLKNQNDLYPTARATPDALGLGRTAGQRSAELIAGLRAELDPSPQNRALTRRSSHLIASIVMRMVREKWMLNHIVTRAGAMTELVRRAIPADADAVTIVEIGAGFSARGLLLAHALPRVQFIEIDLPDVIAEKQKRLQRSSLITIPANLSWIGADLGAQALGDVLGAQKVHVVIAEGLNPYFAPANITQIAARIRENLLPGGVYLCDIALEEGKRRADQAASQFFSRQAGAFLGIARDEHEARLWLLDAGYAQVSMHRITAMAQELGLPMPVLDLSILIAAQMGEVAV
ncbi:MAG: class I SAM-dependent methyltransferase [Anaerolineae bacterium]|nr:class I SAM-dependent methyltransferase [Anaerolineae bacterium]